MHPFRYQRIAAPAEAIAAVAHDPGAAFLAGGTTLVDLMKLDVMTPARLVDINPLPLAAIDVRPDRLRIGALAKMTDVARNPEVLKNYPAISQSLLASASAQLRNMATIGGNLMQRTRCPYFRDVHSACNKRRPGSGCDAIDGENRMHAILGTSDLCIATHASDLAVVLVALDAVILTKGPDGERSIPIGQFHTLPGGAPQIESVLKHGELIVAVEVPASHLAGRSTYLKVRDRASYEFALVSVAAAVAIADGKIKESRIALGGVGTKPWRSPEAEAVLKGKAASPESFAEAAEAALRGAKPRERNGFKVTLAKRAIIRALTVAGGPL